MDKQVLEARLQQLQAQADQLLLQKYKQGEQMTQTQGNLDATYGAMRMLQSIIEEIGDDNDAGDRDSDE